MNDLAASGMSPVTTTSPTPARSAIHISATSGPSGTITVSIRKRRQVRPLRSSGGVGDAGSGLGSASLSVRASFAVNGHGPGSELASMATEIEMSCRPTESATSLCCM